MIAMKQVSIQTLKRSLSALIDEAQGGARIVVTRHERPVAVLGPAEAPHVHVGDRFGSAGLVPLLKAPTRGGYLQVLREDREEVF
jgi:prevent-host-death family protein